VSAATPDTPPDGQGALSLGAPAPPGPAIPADSDLAGLHPTASDFNWLAKRQVGNAIAVAAGRYARGRLLDVGCGEKPYRDVFAPYVAEHVGVDHPESPHALDHVDVLATANSIPLPGSTFDTVLMSELLEHLEEPQAALAETERLLKPGGHVIITAPFAWVIHEAPRDFFRYSPHGLSWLLTQAGLEPVEITAVGGQWSTVALLTSYALRESPLRTRPRFGDPVRYLARGLQHAGWRLDRHNWRPWMAWNHLAVGRKPRSASFAHQPRLEAHAHH
jgi:SAM-dependent methyltransferase